MSCYHTGAIVIGFNTTNTWQRHYLNNITVEKSHMELNHPNVIAKPPRIFIVFIALTLLMNTIAPMTIYDIESNWPLVLGAILCLDGFVLLALAMRRFKSKGTPIATSEKVTKIVSDGIYRYSRNPIYLGMFLVYLGYTLIANNAWGLILGVALYLFMHFGVIRREERYLADQFGEDYIRYQRSVRRWI